MNVRSESIVSPPLTGRVVRNLSANEGTRCRASDLLHWVGMGYTDDARLDKLTFPTRRVAAGSTLVYEGRALDNLYFVGAGCFKIVQTDVEGYEQVLGFAQRGDCIGLDALSEGVHASAAVALEESMVCAVRYSELVALGHDSPVLAHLLHHVAGIELMRRGQAQYLMAASSAEVRIARFLLNFAHRQAEMGYSGRRFRLRMSRRDIANYLGVAHETVSRALTMLAQWHMISVDHREIEIVDVQALERMQRLTRGAAPGSAPRHADLARHVTVHALAA